GEVVVEGLHHFDGQDAALGSNAVNTAAPAGNHPGTGGAMGGVRVRVSRVGVGVVRVFTLLKVAATRGDIGSEVRVVHIHAGVKDGDNYIGIALGDGPGGKGIHVFAGHAAVVVGGGV